MRLFKLIFTLSLFNLVGMTNVPDTQHLQNRKHITWRFIAHRGANNYAPGNVLPYFPENTVASLGEAFAKGASYVECDVHLTLDKKIVVIHDDSLRRTARYNSSLATTLTVDHFTSILDKKIPDLSYANELSQVDVGVYADYLDSKKFAGTRIPLIEEFLAFLKNQPERTIVIELKAGDEHIVEAMNKLITEYTKTTPLQPSQLIFISFDFDVIKSLKKVLPAYKCLFLTIATPDPNEIHVSQERPDKTQEFYFRIKNKNDLDHIIRQAKEANLDGIDVEFDPLLIDADFMRRIHTNGLLGFVWNYHKDDTVETAKHLLSVKADLINTNQPEHFFKVFSAIS